MTTATATTTVTTAIAAALEALNVALWQADLDDDYEAYARIEAAIEAIDGTDLLRAQLEEASARAEAATTATEFAAAMQHVRAFTKALEAAAIK